MMPARRFSFRLALALGWPDPDVMLASMPYSLYLEWMQYYELEPFGEERADLRAGIIAATVANCLARKKGRPAFRVTDFMPLLKAEPKREKTPEELFKKIQAINFLFGGEVIDKRDGN